MDRHHRYTDAYKVARRAGDVYKLLGYSPSDSWNRALKDYLKRGEQVKNFENLFDDIISMIFDDDDFCSIKDSIPYEGGSWCIEHDCNDCKEIVAKWLLAESM